MNVFCLLFCCYSVILSTTYGWKIHTGNSFYNYKSTNFGDKSKYKLKQIPDVYSEDRNIDNPIRDKHLFRLNNDAQKKISDLDDKENALYQRPYFHSNKRKSLSTKVGNHLIKVTSALQSKHVNVKQPKEGGYEISVNPKFSHVIEILPVKENDINEDHGLENSDLNEKLVQKPDTEEAIKTKSELYSEETIETGNEAYDDEEVETESDAYDDEEVETESDAYDDEEVETESDAYDDEEVETESDAYDDEEVETESDAYDDEEVETESDAYDDEEVETESDAYDDEEVETESDAYDDEEVETESDAYDDEEVETESDAYDDEEVETESDAYDDEEVEPENEKKIETESKRLIEEASQTESTTEIGNRDIERLSGNTDQESAFNGESEGSGEDSFSSDDSEDETSKSGRILGIFSRQNATAPNCTTPKGEPGHCRRIRQCILSDTLNNFNAFLQHLCLIRGALVGICCPDNPVIEVSDPDDNDTVSINETDIKQPPEGCGLNVKTRIVGGSISVPHEWTWMVALLKRNRFYCGGVIINNWYILTAAHCVMGMNVKDLAVRLGEYDFNTQNKHQEDIKVSEIKRHAQFVTLTFQHDIALLKLKRSIQYSKFVGSICLPESKARDYSDVQGTVVGWGTVSFGGAASPILRQVTVPVWKNEDCDRTYLLENISDAFMCAGSPEKGEDACQGDSGGPLMATNEKGRWEVIGLVSWGRRCGDPTYPGVYTRVTTYLDWIKENIN